MTYLNAVYQQLQEITQLTIFAAVIKLSTTNQAQCLHTYGRNIIPDIHYRL